MSERRVFRLVKDGVCYGQTTVPSSKFAQYEHYQYTGVFDRNGLNFCEGDIVFDHNTDATCVVRWKDDGGYFYLDGEPFNRPDGFVLAFVKSYPNRFEILHRAGESAE